MTNAYNSGNDAVAEFLPTEVRFHVKVKTAALKGLVGRMAAISASNTLFPGTDLLRFSAIPESQASSSFMSMYATNGSIFMEAQALDVEVQRSGTIHVPSKKLSDVLKLAQDDYVTISCVGFEVQVTSGNSLWRIQVPSKDSMPERSTGTEQVVEVERDELLRILGGVVKATADGFSRSSLIQVQLGVGTAISCDGARMHRVETSSMEGVGHFTIPTIGVKLFLAVLKGMTDDYPTSLGVTDESVTLYAGREQITVLRSKVGFPDVEKVFITQSVMNNTSVVVNRKELQDAVTRVKVFADETLAGVSITTNESVDGKTSVVVHAKDDIGNFSATDIAATIDGKTVVDLKVNYKHLQDALASVASDLVTIRVAKSSKSKKTSAFIEDVDTGFVAVIGQLNKES